MNKNKLEKSLSLKAHVDIKTIQGTSLAGVALQLQQHAGDIASLFDLVANQQSEIDSLTTRLQAYETHTHNYVDNDGTTDINKTTQGVN